MFHRIKHGLSHDETWSLAQRNLTFGKFVFCIPPVYSLKSVQPSVVQCITKNIKNQRFFDRVTLSFVLMPFIRGQNSNIIWQNPVHPNLKSGCSVPAHLQCPSAIIVLTNAPLKGAMSHQPKAAPWGTRATEQTVYTDRGRCLRHFFPCATTHKLNAYGISLLIRMTQ